MAGSTDCLWFQGKPLSSSQVVEVSIIVVLTARVFHCRELRQNGFMSRKLLETTYHVKDLEAAILHYTESLGGKLVKRLPWGVAFIDLDGNGGMISLFDVETYYLENPGVEEFPGPKVILSVDDLDSERADLLAKSVKIGEVLGEKGDIRGFEAFDADGNAIFYFENPNESVTKEWMAK